MRNERDSYNVPPNALDVFDDDAFTENFCKIIEDQELQDLVRRSCIEDLARNPKLGTEIEHTSVWAYWTKTQIKWLPPLVIYYTFTDKRVILLDVHETNLPDNEDESWF